MTQGEWKNRLYYGDNLKIMREEIPDNHVDLVYLDPPFNSGRSYNMPFTEPDGTRSDAQMHVFEDTWKWTSETNALYEESINDKDFPEKTREILAFMDTYLGRKAPMMAYLTNMAPRLVEILRVMNDTASVYLHCDPTASHYLKMLMDSIFGPTQFRNEIIWHYRRWSNVTTAYQSMHDIMLFYSKGEAPSFKVQYQPYAHPEMIETTVRGIVDGKLVRLKDGGGAYIKREKENKGVPMHDVWEDINFIAPTSKERLGYPTQKPRALLERIIKASCPDGGIVFDPFCGCSTALAAAESLKRRWIGIDITYLAVKTIKRRFEREFNSRVAPYSIEGRPKDYASAMDLANRSDEVSGHGRYEFEWWIIDELGGQLVKGEGKKGPGKDGIIGFLDKNGLQKIIIEAKSGENVGTPDLENLLGKMKGSNAVMGVLATLHTKRTMQPFCDQHSTYKFENMHGHKAEYPVLQMVSIKDFFDRKQRIDYPSREQVKSWKDPHQRQLV